MNLMIERNKFLILGISVSVAIGIILVIVYTQGKPIIAPTEDKFSEIQECIMGVQVDYTSNKAVQNKEDVATIFDEFIQYSKENNKDIFGYGSNWRFESASIHGLYKRVKYWKVAASRFSERDKKWIIQTVFDVSENGEVVRLLGCI